MFLPELGEISLKYYFCFVSKTAKIFHVLVVLFVFCLAGTTASRVSAFLSELFGLERFSFLWWIVVIPVVTAIYPFILLFFAFICGKYRYFLDKQKRLYSRVANLFRHSS